jgi:hypothetical protein
MRDDDMSCDGFDRLTGLVGNGGETRSVDEHTVYPWFSSNNVTSGASALQASILTLGWGAFALLLGFPQSRARRWQPLKLARWPILAT